MKKIISCLISVMICMLMFYGSDFKSYADKPVGADTFLTQVKGNEGTWDPNDKSVKDVTKSIMGTIINVIRIIAVGIAIIMLTYVAIKYMSAAPAEKAEFKKSATTFIVGAIVLFGASGILTVIKNFAEKNVSAQ